jgi:hypothetical protein
VGNRLLETRTEPTMWSTAYSYDANGRMEHAGSDGCDWDPNGNMTKGAITYEWDDQAGTMLMASRRQRSAHQYWSFMDRCNSKIS